MKKIGSKDCEKAQSCLNTPGRSLSGFSLVEVVLAIGVLALTIIVVMGLLNPLLRTIKQTTDTTRALGAMGALDGYVQKQRTFNQVYGWVRSNNAVKYLLVSSLGDANSGSEHLVRIWDPTSDTIIQGKQPAATTFLVRLKKSRLLSGLVVDAAAGGTTVYEFGNADGAALPNDAADYALAYLPLEVEIFSIGSDAPTEPSDLQKMASGNNFMFSYAMARNR